MEEDFLDLPWDNVTIPRCLDAVCKNCGNPVFHLMFSGLKNTPHLCVVCGRVVDVNETEYLKSRKRRFYRNSSSRSIKR